MNVLAVWLFGLLSLVFGSVASAAGIGDIATGVSFADVTTAVIAVATALAAVYVTMRGAGLILKAIRGK